MYFFNFPGSWAATPGSPLEAEFSLPYSYICFLKEVGRMYFFNFPGSWAATPDSPLEADTVL